VTSQPVRIAVSTGTLGDTRIPAASPVMTATVTLTPAGAREDLATQS